MKTDWVIYDYDLSFMNMLKDEPLPPHILVENWAENYGTLYTQVCAVLNDAQSVEFTKGGLQLVQVHVLATSQDNESKQDVPELPF